MLAGRGFFTEAARWLDNNGNEAARWTLALILGWLLFLAFVYARWAAATIAAIGRRHGVRLHVLTLKEIPADEPDSP